MTPPLTRRGISKPRPLQLSASCGILLMAILLLGAQEAPTDDGRPAPAGEPSTAPVPVAIPKPSGWHARRPKKASAAPEMAVPQPVQQWDWHPSRGIAHPDVVPAKPHGSPGPPSPPVSEAKEPPTPLLLKPSAHRVQVTPTPEPYSPGGAEESQAPERRAILGAARAAAAAGELRTALCRFDEYLRLNPTDHKVRREFAGVLVRAREWKEAIAQYELLLKALPQSSEIHVDLANVYLQLRRPQKAIPQLLIAQQKSPADLEITTRLAQAYLGEQDLQSARNIVQQLSSQLRPGDPRVPTAFGRVLLDLKRPKQALTFLLPLRERRPQDADILADVIRARAWLGDRAEATRLIGELAGLQPRDIKLRLALANALYLLKEYGLASLVFNQALRVEPANLQARIGMARVDIQTFNVQPAAAFLESCQVETAPRELLALARGELYLIVGKYAEAIQVLHCYLERAPDDEDCRSELAQVYEASGDYEKAKAEWSKLGLLPGQTETARLGTARVLGTQWLFGPSNALCQQVLVEDPESFLAVAQLVYNLGKMRRTGEAVQTAQAYLARPHEDDHGYVIVGLALGRVLLEAHRYIDALPVYQQVASSSLGQVAAAYFGWYYAQMHVQSTEDPRDILRPVLDGTLRDQIELADAAAIFNMNGLIIDVCNRVLASNPQHLPALLRLGEAELRLAVLNLCIEPATATAKLILGISPTNVRGRFILARAFALARKYALAVEEYQKLIKTDANLLLARKELARTLYSASCYGESHLQYQVGQYPTGDEVLQDALGHLRLQTTGTGPTDAAPAWHAARSQEPSVDEQPAGSPGQILTDPAVPPDLGQATSNEPATAQDTLPAPRPLPTNEPAAAADGLAKDSAEQEEECRRRDKRVAIDAGARAAEVQALREEQVARRLKGLRNHQAADAYVALLANQPDNTTARFDLAQVYSEIYQTRPGLNQNSQLPVAAPSDPAPGGLTHAALEQAHELLWMEPYNRDAAVFADWGAMTLQPRVRPQVDLFSQNGRNGLSRIEIDAYSAQAVYPYWDEGDYIGLGYSRIALIPHGYTPLTGNIPSVLLGAQLTDRLRLISQINIEQYENRVSTRPTFDASLSYDMTDWWQVYAAGTLHNLFQNGASIAQDIYYGGAELGSNFHFTRDFDATAFYRLWGYSDDNLEHQIYTLASYRLLPAPCELKFVTSLLFQGFENTNILSGKGSAPLPGGIVPPDFVHPYFAPHAFLFWENRLSYRGTLSRDLFKYAQHIWYQPEYGLAIDNRDTIYHHFRLALNCDVSPCLRVGAAADALLSPGYNLGVGYAFLELRWPPR